MKKYAYFAGTSIVTISYNKKHNRLLSLCLFLPHAVTTRNELRKVLFLALCVTFMFVY